MRILLFFIFLPFLVFSQSDIEIGYVIRISDSNGFSKETAIGFGENSTDDFDICCDAIQLGNPVELNIFTKIDNNNYVINYLSRLNGERIIPIYTSSLFENSEFTISIRDSFGTTNTLIGLIDDQYPGNVFQLPYTTNGPITGQRFSVVFMGLVDINIINGCDTGNGGTINITNNNQLNSSELYLNDELILDDVIGTVSNLSSGFYKYKWSNYLGSDSISFIVDNLSLDITLTLLQDIITIQDPIISPELTIVGLYDEIIWDFGDGSPYIINDLNPIHFYTNVGQFLLKVTVISGSCVWCLYKNITINDIYGFERINKFNNQYFYKYGIDGRLLKK